MSSHPEEIRRIASRLLLKADNEEKKHLGRQAISEMSEELKAGRERTGERPPL